MKIGTFDFETDPFLYGRLPVPFAACVYFPTDEPIIIWGDKCAKRAADALKKLPECKLYAHNSGKFDSWYLIPYANKGTIKIVRTPP